ncbi:MAG TPA: prolipoprotein diacylglyceryl transferase [Clostridia bacterium]|nr:prolipoprotein diacylglyceryl transferase [Clostridia bacterium]
MDPIALQIGPIVIRWYGLLIALAFIIGLLLAMREAKIQSFNVDHLLNVVILGGILGIIGARAYYVIFKWSYYMEYPWEIPAIWHGGLAIHGGLIGAIIAGLLYTKREKLSFWQLADIVSPSIILGQAIGRWGNFFNQEAYGYPTDLPWAMYIDGAYRHPTFLYEFIWNLIVFFFLLWLRRRKGIRRGEVFLAYLIGYSLGRLIIEGFRTDSLMLGPFRVAQLISLVFIIGSAFLIYYRRKKVC